MSKTLKQDSSRVERAYFMHALLQTPEVAGGVATTEYLQSLGVLKDSFSGRNDVVTYLAEQRAKDPAVAAYYRQKLAAGDATSVEELAYAAMAIWEDTFVPELVTMATGARQYGVLRDALTVLDRHAALWASTTATREAPSAHVLGEFARQAARSEPDDQDEDPPGTYTFLGFTHYWGRSRSGTAVVQRKTAAGRLSRSLRAIRE